MEKLALNKLKGFTTFSLHERGFTLVELMVVISIIAILAVVAFTIFTGVQKGARDAKRRADVASMAKSFENNYGNGQYPAALTSTMFAGSNIPQPPRTGESYDVAVNPDRTGFQVCASLDENVNTCNTSSDNCYCVRSQQGEYIAGPTSTPGPTATPGPTNTPAPTATPIAGGGPVLSICNSLPNKFCLNGTPIAPYGTRAFKAIDDGPGGANDNSPTTNLIANLDAYKARGANTISISFQAGTSGSGPADANAFNADGTLRTHYTDRIAQVLDAAADRNMVVFVSYFVASMDQAITVDDINNTYLRAATINATNFLKQGSVKYPSGWNNVALYTVNEMGHGSLDHAVLRNLNDTNVNTILGWVKGADPQRITSVGQGSPVQPNNLGIPAACGNSDFCASTGRTGIPEVNRPYVVIEYERQDSYTSPGQFSDVQKTTALGDAQTTKNNGAYWVWLSAWQQIYPPHFELGGDGSVASPGVLWLYDGLVSIP